MNISALGIDLGKSVLYLFGVGADGQVTYRGKLSRAKLLPFMANLPACRGGM